MATRLIAWAVLAVGVLPMGGCAAMSADACRSKNWYEIGQRDALVYGVRPQITQYAAQSARHDVQPGETDYLTGWYYGERERERRMAGSEH